MDKKLKVNNILLAITIMLMAATNAFADKESNGFLTRVAQATKGSARLDNANGTSTTTGSFDKKTFTVTTTINIYVNQDEDFVNTISQYYDNFLKNTDLMVLDMLWRETQHNGFIENMIKSKATMKFVVEIPTAGIRYEKSIKPNEIKCINVADTANIPQLLLAQEVKMSQIYLPLDLGVNFTMNSLTVENQTLVMECVLDNNQNGVSQIEKHKNLYEMMVVNSMKDIKFDKYVRSAANIGYPLILRIKDSKSGEIYNIPVNNAGEVFAKENTTDHIDLISSRAALSMQSELPEKINDYQTLTGFDYSDKTMIYTYEIKGEIAKNLYAFYNIGNAKLYDAIYRIPDEPETESETDKYLNNVNYKYIYKNPEWNNDIIVKWDKSEYSRMKTDKWYQDSLKIAFIAESFNIDSKYENQIRKAHYFDGKRYTISLLCKNKQMSTDIAVDWLNKNEIPNLKRMNSAFTQMLCRWGIDIRLHSKNEITGKQSEFTLPSSILKQ